MEGILETIENAKNDILIYEEKKSLFEEKTNRKKTLEEKLTKIVNTKEKCIKDTIAEEKKKIDDAYNQVLVEITRKVNKAKEEKNKEILKNKKELIEKETKDLREKNEEIEHKKKEEIKENKISSFVNTKFYWTVFKPSNIIQIIKTFLLFAVLSLITTSVFLVVFGNSSNAKNKTYTIIFLMIVSVFIWILIWYLFNMLFSRNMTIEITEKIKAHIKNIETNNKAIKNITIQIMKDNDESKFDYTQIDREIETANLELSQLNEKREKEIEYFNQTIINQIKERIENESMQEIKDIKYELENIDKEYDKIQKEYKDKQKEIINKYDSTIGKDNLTLNKLVELETIIKNNKTEELVLDRAKDLLSKK